MGHEHIDSANHDVIPISELGELRLSVVDKQGLAAIRDDYKRVVHYLRHSVPRDHRRMSNTEMIIA
jgi:hypothetical protein